MRLVSLNQYHSIPPPPFSLSVSSLSLSLLSLSLSPFSLSLSLSPFSLSLSPLSLSLSLSLSLFSISPLLYLSLSLSLSLFPSSFSCLTSSSSQDSPMKYSCLQSETAYCTNVSICLPKCIPSTSFVAVVIVQTRGRVGRPSSVGEREARPQRPSSRPAGRPGKRAFSAI